MPVISFARAIAGAVRRFPAAKEGNIAVIFTIALVPVLAFIGMAIDYSRASKARSHMQAALDSAALMVSRDLSNGIVAAADIKTKSQAYFEALYKENGATLLSFDATYTAADATLGSTVQLKSTGQIQTDFMKVVHFPTMDFGADSTAAWGHARLRVAMALDNTGSMQEDGKMTALQNAAAGKDGLIDQLSRLSKTDGDVYVSVIPFAKDVNVGSIVNSNVIDWTDWLNPPTQQPNNGTKQAKLPKNWHAIGPGAVCPFTTSNAGFVCTIGPVNGSATSIDNNSGNNMIPSSGTYSGYICPSLDANSHTFYNGCWDSEAAGTGVFCSGSSSCACPTKPNGNNVNGCSCSGQGSGKSCTGNLYVHNWTQPGPNAHGTDQQRVSAFVGFANKKWVAGSSEAPTVRNDWTGTSTNPLSTWTGCVTDRTNPNDATGDLPSADVTTLFPANQYNDGKTSFCATSANPRLKPVIPLSSDWGALKTAINAMKPTGSTNQAIGLAWAWQSLLPGGPLPVPAEDDKYTYNRVIIILSDGLNTEDRWPDNGNGKNQNGTAIDDRQALLCANLKALKDPKTNNPMYAIYTIHLNTGKPADPESKVLKDCASSPDKFYSLYNSKDVVSAFNSIGTDLSKLRVAR